jgi:hypothetical protein
MSLKNFHILFITISVILTVYFGSWAFSIYRATPAMTYLALGVASVMTGAALVVYEMAFVRKCRRDGIE